MNVRKMENEREEKRTGERESERERERERERESSVGDSRVCGSRFKYNETAGLAGGFA
jgi:hypothetical protein